MVYHRWYVVQCHPKCERLVARELAEKGFTAYLPMVTIRRPAKPRALLSRKMRRDTPETVLLDVPFFPGYLFAKFDRDEQDWFEIVYAEGVKAVLKSSGGRPIPVAFGVVERLQAVSSERHVITQALAPIPTDTRLTITDGAFADHQGVCLWSDDTRVRVLLTIMGQAVPTTIERWKVKT